MSGYRRWHVDPTGIHDEFLTPRSPEPRHDTTRNARVIPVVHEEIEIEQVREHTGTVRVRKVVHHVEEPVSASGYREMVEAARVPVNRAVAAPQPPWQQDGALVIPVYEERLVRQLFLVEEIHVTRRRESFDDSGTAHLRREEVIVERLDPETRQWVAEDRRSQ